MCVHLDSRRFIAPFDLASRMNPANLDTFRENQEIMPEMKCNECKDRSHVYAIAPESRNWVKIGMSLSIRSRLSTGQGFHVERLEVIGYKARSKSGAKNLERSLHQTFQRHRVGAGTEIFDGRIIDQLMRSLDEPDPGLIGNMCRSCACPSEQGTQWCSRHRRIKKNGYLGRGRGRLLGRDLTEKIPGF